MSKLKIVVLSVAKYLIASLLSFVAIGLHAESAQKLGSPVAVLDALQNRQGDVVLAFIDSSADQSNPLTNLQGLLSVYSLELNGVDLGQVRRNDVLQVRPRLGLNKLIVRDAFKDAAQVELNFPAMRSAGVSTAIVEIQTSRQFAWIRALPLSGRDVQAIHDALNGSQHGGMGRVIDLIRSRGNEPPPSQRKHMNWSSGRSNFEETDDQSDSEPVISKSISSGSSNTTATDSGVSSAIGREAESDKVAEPSSQSTEKKSSVNISADRRSYY
ncbi:MAG TPA: hypothetical protein DEF72_02615 [Gammaproteobacteria bacterium]|nr:hypothetical protein [Gammaproteobacteria bacterium]